MVWVFAAMVLLGGFGVILFALNESDDATDSFDLAVFGLAFILFVFVAVLAIVEGVS